jgi:4-diphosphocytidyl-2-C-methyl-D-erythritol kinase
LKTYKSYAKLNLFLDVIALYKNNYHKIRSLFVETDLHDIIEYEPNKEGKIRVFDKSGTLPSENLLVKAAAKFVQQIGVTPFGVDFYVDKKIPIGGGMGGGSSNAAGVLKILNSLWKINYGFEKLENIAGVIGADVPFFIKGGIRKVSGIGQILSETQSKIRNLNFILILPEVSVSTPLAYKKIDEANLSKESFYHKKKYKNIITGFENCNYNLIIENVYNKFEEVVFKEYPVLLQIKNDILKSGADVSFMSGSGSTMVGIYENDLKKESGVKQLKKNGYKIIDKINLHFKK